MKKLLALMLAAALALSLVACGGGSGAGDTNTPSTGNGDTTSTDTPSGGGEDSKTETPTMTKEEMLEQATEYRINDISVATVENIVNAKKQYCNVPILTSGTITNINDDYVKVVNSNIDIDIYLSEDEISVLQVGQMIEFVGIMSDTIQQDENLQFFYTMKQAYLINDTVEWNCKTRGPSIDNDYDWLVEYGADNALHHVYFSDSVDITTLGLAMELKLSGKQVNGSLYDAIIIE